MNVTNKEWQMLFEIRRRQQVTTTTTTTTTSSPLYLLCQTKGCQGNWGEANKK